MIGFPSPGMAWTFFHPPSLLLPFTPPSSLRVNPFHFSSISDSARSIRTVRMCFPCCWPFTDVWLEDPPKKKAKKEEPKKEEAKKEDLQYFVVEDDAVFYPVRHMFDSLFLFHFPSLHLRTPPPFDITTQNFIPSSTTFTSD